VSLCEDNFSTFVQPLLDRLREKNRGFRQQHGTYRSWDWEPDVAILSFLDPLKPTLEIEVSVVGTSQDDSWEWSWANPNIDSNLKIGMDKVRDFGRAHSFQQVTTPFLDCDEETGWTMTAVAAHVLNAPGAFHFPTGDGVCYLLFRVIHELSHSCDNCTGAPLDSNMTDPNLDAVSLARRAREFMDEPEPTTLR
jgi:hypothetical protein